VLYGKSNVEIDGSGGLIEHLLPNRSMHKPIVVHPLVQHFLFSLLLIGALGMGTAFVMFLMDYPDLEIRSNTKLALGFAFRVNLFLHAINGIVYFMNRLKDSQVETERLKKENLEAQFEALRNQINPHFLFNSFNVLSQLVHKDADSSVVFIEQLSKVYRYLIYHQEKRMVELKTELEFIQSYLFLLKIRFQENLVIEINMENPKDYYVIPVSLQLMIENAIKHNVVSKKSPLHISISQSDDYLEIKNNLQLKDVKEPSTGLGLKNIISRYRLLIDKEVIIENDNHYFSVKIPLIKVVEYESALS
jgi:LytS/YehU family sensor histidine kinase